MNFKGMPGYPIPEARDPRGAEVPGIITKKPALPTDAAKRKAVPLCTGVLDYFPDALADVARLSQVGNDQHNPGQPLHWSKHKSTDHGDCLLRHQIDRGTLDTDKVRHSTKVAWRALAQLQIEIEAERAGLSVQNYLAKLKREAETPEPAPRPVYPNNEHRYEHEAKSPTPRHPFAPSCDGSNFIED